MVTKRPDLARRAVDCYASQDYPARELVIVSDGEEECVALHRYAAARCPGPLVMTAVAAGSKPLGAMRNLAIDLAHGEIVCQWDDDDLSHPRRLSVQVALMQADGADACFMTDQLQLTTCDQSLYWCDWTQTRGWPLPWSTIPNTLLCRKASIGRYPETGALARRSEDTEVMRTLLKRARVSRLRGLGWLYVYVSHGANTWHQTHHLEIVRATGMEASALVTRRSELTAGTIAYALGELVVRDWSGGEVYRLVTGLSDAAPPRDTPTAAP
jgi:glycosyltransferase involved in cell wall biosynthesis